MPESNHDFVIPEEDRAFVAIALTQYAKNLRRAHDEFPGTPELVAALSKVEEKALELASQVNPPRHDSIPGGFYEGPTYPRTERDRWLDL